MAPPACFKPELFAFEPISGQCIAPVVRSKGDKRCTNTISPLEFQEAVILADAIHTGVLEYHEEKLAGIRLTLLLCCGEVHRSKLYHEGGCIQSVAARYRSGIAAGHFPHLPPPSSSPNDRVLRSRWVARPGVEERVLKGQQSKFTKYTAVDEEITLRLLFKPVPDGKPGDPWPVSGFLYAFRWPSHPGMIKIGYSAYEPQLRMRNKWSQCCPGSEIFWTERISFPRRMEELVHNELGAQRRVDGCCSNQDCKQTHIEFFKTTQKHVIKVLDAYVEIDRREPLYCEQSRSLTDVWKRRIPLVNPRLVVTSRWLLKTLQKDQADREARQVNDQCTSLLLMRPETFVRMVEASES